MAIAFVQQQIATFTAAASVIDTLGAAPKVGSCLVLFSANSLVAVTSVTGGGVTWVKAAGIASHVATDLWFGLNSDGTSSAITVNYLNATGTGAVNVTEFSGVVRANAIDVNPASTNGTVSPVTSPVAVTTNASDLVVACAGYNGIGATTGGPTNSFVALTEGVNTRKIIPAYLLPTATGSYSTAWTEAAGGWDAAILALKAALLFEDDPWKVNRHLPSESIVTVF